ncbi:MAG: hypothetical protein SF069_09275 [Phycisphaerae bacterium]|nr:hypothetical protein [Phycisphaerae bacterium]
MLRNVFAVVLGYAAMAVVIMAAVPLIAWVFGIEVSWENPPREVPMELIVGNLLTTVPAAMLGGWVCTKAARGQAVPGLVLLGLVVLMGIANFVAQEGSAAPAWYRAALPILGATGVFMGCAIARPAARR